MEKDSAIIQNLKDAGCEETLIRDFLDDFHQGRMLDGLKLLEAHRRTLLNAVHREERKIDCLDVLICKLRKA